MVYFIRESLSAERTPYSSASDRVTRSPTSTAPTTETSMPASLASVNRDRCSGTRPADQAECNDRAGLITDVLVEFLVRPALAYPPLEGDPHRAGTHQRDNHCLGDHLWQVMPQCGRSHRHRGPDHTKAIVPRLGRRASRRNVHGRDR